MRGKRVDKWARDERREARGESRGEWREKRAKSREDERWREEMRGGGDSRTHTQIDGAGVLSGGAVPARRGRRGVAGRGRGSSHRGGAQVHDLPRGPQPGDGRNGKDERLLSCVFGQRLSALHFRRGSATRKGRLLAWSETAPFCSQTPPFTSVQFCDESSPSSIGCLRRNYIMVRYLIAPCLGS